MATKNTAAYDAAALLAQIEFDTVTSLLAKLTAFTDDLTAMATALSFPPSYVSPAKNAITEIIGSLAYRRDQDLPSRIASYQQATGQTPATQSATPPTQTA